MSIKQLVEMADNCEGAIAIRIDNARYDVGDTLPVSRVWDDGNPTEELLEGTSCLRLGRAEQAVKYRGRYGYVISGRSLYEGNDLGETVVEDATVLAVVEL